MQRFRDAVRERTPRLKTQRRVKPRSLSLNRLRRNKRVKELIRRVNQHLRGWHGYFRTVWSGNTPFKTFDFFVRSRVRASLTGRVGAGWWYYIVTNDALAQLRQYTVISAAISGLCRPFRARLRRPSQVPRAAPWATICRPFRAETDSLIDVACLRLLSLDDLQAKWRDRTSAALAQKGSSGGEPYTGKP